MEGKDAFYNNSIFWVEVDRIEPNPYQPRREFDEAKLEELADSIRQYGVLQPLVVTRHEEFGDDNNALTVRYELIAGERRLRASKIAGLAQVPVTIRRGTETAKAKLELAIIENVQREDLNAIDRAKAFDRLVKEFGYKHQDVGKRVGKSREFISNTLRLLMLPEDMQQALAARKITEGHTRPLLMLVDRPEEQRTLFKEIMYKKLTVRESEGIARRIAVERARRKPELNPEMLQLERELTETLGTRVHIEQKEVGGKITIDYFSPDDLRSLIDVLNKKETEESQSFLDRFIDKVSGEKEGERQEEKQEETNAGEEQQEEKIEEAPVDDSSKEDEKEDEDLYSVKNFSI